LNDLGERYVGSGGAIAHWIDQWAGLANAIVALLAAVTTLVAGLLALRIDVLKLERGTGLLLGFFFLIPFVVLILMWLRSRSRGASRLIDPDALNLDPQSREQLVGRREDLDRLLNALANPLVFLIGESGCGKTALLRAGVEQGSVFIERFLPIYIDMSVLDWEDGPVRAVRDRFLYALRTDDPARSRLDARSKPKAYSDVFSDYEKRMQRRPLLLLDQFDDYQARHRERFLPTDAGTWLSGEEIARNNAFWRVLGECLRNDAVSIVVTCRADAAAGLDSMRFVRPVARSFNLPRLKPGLVQMIIDLLTDRPAGKPAVIANPEGGWMMLRDRLVDDLEARGQMLPQQLKVVLSGLRTLRRLTLAAYARQDRLAGLEAAFIDGALKSAALAATLHYEDVLRLAGALVDRTRQPPDKAPPQTTADLAAVIGVPEDIALRALESLGADEVIRPYSDAAGEATSWQLDHAYLAQPIIHVEGERDKLHRLLETHARAYAEARRVQKWSALLPVRTQVWLFVARLRGRLRYGEHRAYTLRSLLARGLPTVAVVGGVVLLVWAAGEYREGSNIEQQLAQIDTFTNGLRDLASGSWVTRQLVTHDIFSRPASASWFLKNPAPIVRALVGLDPSRLDALIRAHLTPDALRQDDPSLRAATRVLLRASSAPLTHDTKEQFKRAVMESLRGNWENSELEDISHGMATVAEALANDDPLITEWFDALRDRINITTDPDRLEFLAAAYAAVAGKLKEPDPLGAKIFAALRDEISKPDRRGWKLADTYEKLAIKIRKDDPLALEEAAKLREAINRTAEPDQLLAFAWAYAAVAAKLKEDDPDAANLFGKLREAIGNTTDLSQLQGLGLAYAKLAALLNKGDPRAEEEVAALHRAIDKQPIGYQLEALGHAYAEVATKLARGDTRAVEVVDALRAAITKDPVRLSPLALVYTEVATRLTEGDSGAAEVVAALGDAIRKTSSSFTASAYAAVATLLKQGDPRAGEEVAMLGDAIRTSVSPPIDRSRKAMSRQLQFDEPQGLVFPRGDLLPLIAGGRSAGAALNELVLAYVAVAAKLNEDDPRVVAEVEALHNLIDGIRHAMDAGTGEDLPSHLAAVAKGYAAVANKLKKRDPHPASVFAALRDAIGKVRWSSELKPLTDAYEEVSKLKGADLQNEVNALRKAISNTTDSSRLGAMAQAYAAVAKADRQAIVPNRDLAVLLDRMRFLRNSDECTAFAAAITEAIQGLPRDKAGLIVTAVLLEPVFAGEPSGQLVKDYEKIIGQSTAKLDGSVWRFAEWAQHNLPEFDPHRANVRFLFPEPDLQADQ
jgi:hypothetical protein